MTTVEIPAYQTRVADVVIQPSGAPPRRIVSRRIQGAPAMVSVEYADVPGRTLLPAAALVTVQR